MSKIQLRSREGISFDIDLESTKISKVLTKMINKNSYGLRVSSSSSNLFQVIQFMINYNKCKDNDKELENFRKQFLEEQIDNKQNIIKLAFELEIDELVEIFNDNLK